MEEWDQETLEKVVESKKNEYNQNKPTDIVSPYSFSLFVSQTFLGEFWYMLIEDSFWFCGISSLVQYIFSL